MDYKTYLKETRKRRTEIKHLRTMGWTWTQIGAAFQITRQRAQQIGAKK